MSDDLVRRRTEEVVGVARRAGLDAVGVADASVLHETRRVLHERKAAGLHGGMNFTYRSPDRSTDPAGVIRGARSVVVGALRYNRAGPASEPFSDRSTDPSVGHSGAPSVDPDRSALSAGPRGRVASYAWGDRYRPLKEALGAVAAHLRSTGYRAQVCADDNALVDRAIAHRAGVGWFGRNANLLVPGQGSWFVLGAVVTDAPLLAATEPVPDGCGTCRACEPACPTGAIVAPGVIDARRCLAWLVQAPGSIPREFREAVGDRVYGCDECQEVCPPNRLAERRSPAPPAAGDDVATVDLLEWLRLPDADLLARHRHWYIADRDPRNLRRNALVALGNVGDPADPRVRAALREALGSPDPMLRGHAVWAGARLGLRDLLPSHDPDPTVAEEIEWAQRLLLSSGARELTR